MKEAREGHACKEVVKASLGILELGFPSVWGLKALRHGVGAGARRAGAVGARASYLSSSDSLPALWPSPE
jgi:hypothetical protein